MQSDPVGLEGGENSFVYVGDNPLARVDESGEFFDRVLASAGAAIGSVIEPGGGTVIGAAIGATAGKWLDRWIMKKVASWASPYPPSKADGLMALKMLETELSKVNKKMYKRLKQCGAFDRAIRFIKSATVDGYYASSIKNSYSFDCKPNRYNGERIDIEIRKGQAFVGY